MVPPKPMAINPNFIRVQARFIKKPRADADGWALFVRLCGRSAAWVQWVLTVAQKCYTKAQKHVARLEKIVVFQ